MLNQPPQPTTEGPWLFKGLGLFLFLGALFLFPKTLHAAAPIIEVLSPSPNAVLLTNTNIVFELQITSGNPGNPFLVEWDFDWDGTTPAWQVTDYSIGPDPIIIFPARYGLNPLFRYQGWQFTTVGRHHYRLRVTDTTSGEVAIVAGSANAVDELALTGYAWIGASTQDDGNDAVGWISLSCANINTVCVTLGNDYNLRFNRFGSFASFNNSTWLGESDTPSDPYPIGYLSFKKSVVGLSSLAPQESSKFTPPLGEEALSSFPLVASVPAGSDGEDWNSLSETNRIYTSYEDVGGTLRFPGQVAGWGRMLTPASYGVSLGQNDWGWLHLRGDEAPRPYSQHSSGGFSLCEDCSPSKAKCNICKKVDYPATDPPCPFCVPQQTSQVQYSCNSCYDCTSTGICASCEFCSTYGVSYNTQRATLVGYGWSGGEASPSEYGLGWVKFNPPLGGSSVLQAWLATRYGDIFVGTGGISVTTPLPAPPGSFNATYIIQANGTIAFTSEAGYVQPNYPSQIRLPSAERQYINVLGRLDFPGMMTVGANRYGVTETVTSATVNAWGSSKVLDGKIYLHSGNLSITSPIPIVFQPGSGAQSGAGTIIVDGNLSINTPITYNTTTLIGSIVNLPSVAFLVRGNVTIGPSVGSLVTESPPEADVVGAYLVIGHTGRAGVCGGVPKPDGGALSTGSTSALELIVHGLMMARCFNFERTIASPRGSEQIIYDGRFIANPPPGLQDLSAVLPTIREVTP